MSSARGKLSPPTATATEVVYVKVKKWKLFDMTCDEETTKGIASTLFLFV